MSGRLPHGTRRGRETNGSSVHRVANERHGDQSQRVSTGVDARSAESTARGRQRLKPRLRGVSHKYAAWAAAVAGLGLVVAAPTQRSRLAMAVYAVALVGLFATSALYHRITWPPAGRQRMRRLDHAMIFVLIAGTYTPFAALVLSPSSAAAVLSVAWGAALAGVGLQFAWSAAPKWVMALLCVAVGWVALATLPELWFAVGPVPIALLMGGGALYTVGAVTYAQRRPDPAPTVFGYHEVFHALVIGAALLHFVAVAGWVLPRG
jgi:hemolysin III